MKKKTYPSKRSPLIIVDVDGTLLNFRKIDEQIIQELFASNKVVKKLDYLLWKINELDYISNTRIFFVLRMLLYAIFSNYSFFYLLDYYDRRYVVLGNKEMEENYQKVLRLKKYGYHICVLTHNFFSNGFADIVPLISTNKKKSYIRKFLLKKYHICYIIGNNYLDDMKTALAYGAIPFYVGKSKLVKDLVEKKHGMTATTLEKALVILENTLKAEALEK